jgi:hypothetical protein
MVILTISTADFIQAQPSFTLLKATELASFQTVSALEYYDKTLMAVGNNATRILLLNSDHKILDSLSLFNYPNQTDIANIGTGIQATAVIDLNGKPALLIMGSGERRSDKSDVWIFPLTSRSHSQVYSPSFAIPDFFKRLKKSGIPFINIDGAAQVSDRIVLANAANKQNNENHFIITEFDFWTKGATADIHTMSVNNPSLPYSISGLEYDANKDFLLFSAVGLPINNQQDGTKKGYVGFIQSASTKLKGFNISPDYLLDLDASIPILAGKNVQSICLENTKDARVSVIHLCAIDDKGKCFVYKIAINW